MGVLKQKVLKGVEEAMQTLATPNAPTPLNKVPPLITERSQPAKPETTEPRRSPQGPSKPH